MGQPWGRNADNVESSIDLLASNKDGIKRKDNKYGENDDTLLEFGSPCPAPISKWKRLVLLFIQLFVFIFRRSSKNDDEENGTDELPVMEPQTLTEDSWQPTQIDWKNFVEWVNDDLGYAFHNLGKRNECIDSIPFVFVCPTKLDKRITGEIEAERPMPSSFGECALPMMLHPREWAREYVARSFQYSEEQTEEHIQLHQETVGNLLKNAFRSKLMFRVYVKKHSQENNLTDISEPFLKVPRALMEKDTVLVSNASEKTLEIINTWIKKLGLEVKNIGHFTEVMPTQMPYIPEDHKIVDEVMKILVRSSKSIELAKRSSKCFTIRAYYLKTIPFRYYKIVVCNTNAPKQLDVSFYDISRQQRERHGNVNIGVVESFQVGTVMDTEGGTQIEKKYRNYVDVAQQHVRCLMETDRSGSNISNRKYESEELYPGEWFESEK